MAKKHKHKSQKRKNFVDPYTGEKKYPVENSEKFIEVVPQETRDRAGGNYLLNEETSMDHYAADENADAAAERSASYTEDEEIEDDFAERQQLAASGRKVMEEELDEHHSKSPELSGGDLDASWETSDQAGEETVGGSVPTPDQDVVDEIGQAAGLTYKDDEPLNYNKIHKRDRERWELNRASRGEDAQELEDVQEDIDEDERKYSPVKKSRDAK